MKNRPQPIEAPIDRHAISIRILQRMADIEARWKRCSLRACRRARRCSDADIPCAPPYKPNPHRNDGKVMAELQAAIRARLAELGDE